MEVIKVKLQQIKNDNLNKHNISFTGTRTIYILMTKLASLQYVTIAMLNFIQFLVETYLLPPFSWLPWSSASLQPPGTGTYFHRVDTQFEHIVTA